VLLTNSIADKTAVLTFPKYQQQGFDYLAVIYQYGIFSAVTMQLPRGLLCV